MRSALAWINTHAMGLNCLLMMEVTCLFVMNYHERRPYSFAKDSRPLIRARPLIRRAVDQERRAVDQERCAADQERRAVALHHRDGVQRRVSPDRERAAAGLRRDNADQDRLPFALRRGNAGL